MYKIQLSSLNGVKPKNYVHRFPAAFDDGFFVVVNNGRFSPLLSDHVIEKLLIEENKVLCTLFAIVFISVDLCCLSGERSIAGSY